MTKKLPKFTQEQIIKCKVCKHASANVNHPTEIGWCGYHRVWIDDRAKKKMPPLIKRAGNFTKAGVKHVKSGFKTRSHLERARVMVICENCEWVVRRKIGLWCPHCGCCGNLASQWSTKDCPKGK